jgi:hypothetical protein
MAISVARAQAADSKPTREKHREDSLFLERNGWEFSPIFKETEEGGYISATKAIVPSF